MSKKTVFFRLKDLSAACIIRMLIRHAWMLVLSALTCAMAMSLALSYLHTPLYRAEMTWAVTARKSSAVVNTSVSVTSDVAEVLAELLETDVINNTVRDSSEKLAAFGGSFSASQVPESNFITVTCTDVTPKGAFLALRALSEHFPDIAKYVSQNTVLQVIREPSVSSRPINSLNGSAYTALAAVGGALAMAALLVLIMLRRETVQTLSGAKRSLDAPIIASLTHEKRQNAAHGIFHRARRTSMLITSPTVSSAYSEQINTVCSRLEHEHDASGARVFVVTGVGEDEGKSTVSANIATMLALKGRRVALVDADFRKPAMNNIFGDAYNSELPLNQMLRKPFSKENFLSCIVRHSDYGLYMCFSSEPDFRLPELLCSDVMRKFLRQLCVFDFVIVDTPPLGLFSDAETLADFADASLLVVRQDRTSACDINDAVDSLRQTRSKFLGCVLNDMIGTLPQRYGYSRRYGYGYGYGMAAASKGSSKTGGDTDGK